MSKLRVLIIDDAVVIRRIVSDVLGADPELEVAGTAANGKIGLQKIPQVNPDLITLDLEMPVMDGMETLREIRKLYPKLPVIIFSTLTSCGASSTLDALAAGASDYVTKPANVGSVTIAMDRIRGELIPKIKALCGRIKPSASQEMKVNRPGVDASMTMARMPTSPRQGRRAIEAVVMGVSTGGPNALAEIIPALPGDLPVPVLIVQHMPPVFTRLLAERLSQKSKVTVREAVAGDVLQPGTVYIAAGDYHMSVERGPEGPQIAMSQSPAENSCRPAVDVLFRTAAKLYGPSVLAVVLTGMGCDGTRGCQDIRDAGGNVVIQDEATSIVWGMPGSVARAGLAEQMIPLGEVARHVSDRVDAGRRSGLRIPQQV